MSPWVRISYIHSRWRLDSDIVLQMSEDKPWPEISTKSVARGTFNLHSFFCLHIGPHIGTTALRTLDLSLNSRLLRTFHATFGHPSHERIKDHSSKKEKLLFRIHWNAGLLKRGLKALSKIQSNHSFQQPWWTSQTCAEKSAWWLAPAVASEGALLNSWQNRGPPSTSPAENCQIWSSVLKKWVSPRAATRTSSHYKVYQSGLNINGVSFRRRSR